MLFNSQLFLESSWTSGLLLITLNLPILFAHSTNINWYTIMCPAMSTAHQNYYYTFIQRNETINSKTYEQLYLDTNNPNVYQDGPLNCCISK